MSEIKIGEYLFKRIKEIGIETVFGVPGDYELALLDILPAADLKWTGCPNELVAAYAADGYGRIKGAGALITTFGPGETSALCGTAGSFCEFVPVVHIVGYPGVKAQFGDQILHHTLGDKKYDHFVKMSDQVSCAAIVITDPKTAAQKIDQALNAMFYKSQPVYIGVPVDVAQMTISTTPLKTKIVRTLPPNDPSIEEAALKAIIERLQASKSPIIIADGGATRHDVLTELSELVEVSKLPVFATGMGKGAVSEDIPHFGGVYAGAGTKSDVKKVIETSDCVLWVGNYPSDFNTGEFSEHVETDVTIDFQRFYVMVGNTRYEVKMKYLLQKLVAQLREHPLGETTKKMSCTPYLPLQPPKEDHITHSYLWQRLSSFLRATDILVTETGTAQAGINETRFPAGLKAYTQNIFGSIGFASGAAVGSAVAGEEIEPKAERLVLVTGEGSLQLTIQAFSILQRQGVRPIIFVIENGGYTVERLIHGRDAAYNKVPLWDYTMMLKAFGSGLESKSFRVGKSAELDALLSDEAFGNASYPQLVELTMDPFDAPIGVLVIGAGADKNNSG